MLCLPTASTLVVNLTIHLPGLFQYYKNASKTSEKRERLPFNILHVKEFGNEGSICRGLAFIYLPRYYELSFVSIHHSISFGVLSGQKGIWWHSACLEMFVCSMVSMGKPSVPQPLRPCRPLLFHWNLISRANPPCGGTGPWANSHGCADGSVEPLLWSCSVRPSTPSYFLSPRCGPVRFVS